MLAVSIIYLLQLHWVWLFWLCGEIRVGRAPTLKNKKQIETSGKIEYVADKDEVITRQK